MKTENIAAISAASIIAVVVLLVAYPAMAATNAATANNPLSGTAIASTTQTSIIPTPSALSAGQTLTFTSTTGQFHVVGHPGQKGTASGTLVLTVTGSFTGGYALSVSSGSLNIDGTTYAIASGSAEMGPYEAHLVGQGSLAIITPVGQTSPTSNTPGAFLFAAGAHANFQGQTYNTLRYDVQANGEEYAVLLLVTVTVS